jgi:peptide/nickel transport system ATP-binding protein/glutathione transport system ATP-binding protein
MRLVEFGGGTITAGSLNFERADGTMLDVAAAPAQVMGAVRGHEIGMIFQEPMTALNPVFTIERQLTDGLMLHKGLTQAAASARALELLQSVRIPEPERRTVRRYAPAGGDCHGYGLRSQASHRR